MSQYIRFPPIGGGTGDAFSIIQPDSGTSPTAGAGAVTLTVTSSSSNITVTGNSATNTLTLGFVPPSSSVAWGSITGTLSAQTDLSTALAGKQATLTIGDITSGTTGVGVSGGIGAIIGSGVSITVQNATTGQPGLLTAADWNTFNGKQASGNYITALTGEVAASGPGSASATITNAAVIGKVLTGFSSGAGTVAATDTILQAVNKLDGNTALKAPLASPTFTGTITTPLTASRALATGSSNELAVSATTSTELGYVAGVTSAIQTQINTKAPTASPTFSGTITTPLTPSKAVVTGASNELATSSTSATEIGYVAGVTSAIQTQLDSKAAIANNQPARNYLINSGFDFWQRFGASPSQTVANTISTYVADRWYIKNTLGTNGVITGSQVAGTTNGSKWGLSVKITTAPTAAQVNGTELYQTLENFDSLNFYGQTASFGILVKALGLVTQVGVQFYYKTTEAKVDTQIGSEVLTTVNSSTFVSCSTLAQAIGTSQTTAGVIGVRVRITGVSSGNLYALNNGFIVEQAQLNLGSTLGAWQRAGNTNSEELRMCQRYYAKSYDLLIAPGTASNFNGLVFTNGGVTTSASHAVNSFFKVSLRTAPTATSYDLAGASGKYSIFDASGNASSGFTPSGFVAGENSVYLVANSVTTAGIGSHYTVDAEI